MYPPEICTTVLERLTLYAKIRTPLNITDNDFEIDKESARL